ncbi:hypothetical protein [Roseibium sp.]|uniref:hypothetical protein n=1 Tax=Roseibium sp. TaxID=1936156 RepID=UPI003A96E3E5
MDNLKDQVSIIYDEFRTTELSKEYYSQRISRTRKKLRNIDIYLALFAAGSGVAGFGLWNYSIFGVQIGQIAFGFLAGIALMLGLAKPYLRLEDDLERLSSIQGTYASIAHILKDIVNNIKSSKALEDSDKKVYSALRQIRGGLEAKEDKPPDSKLVDKTQDIVNNRYPPEEFWWPDK